MKISIQEIRQMVRKSLNENLSEMANIATLYKLADDYKTKTNNPEAQRKGAQKVIAFLEKYPNGAPMKQAAQEIYGSFDTASVNSTFRLLKGMGIIVDVGLEKPKVDKPAPLGLGQGRPKITNEEIKQAGIGVIRKFSKGDTAFDENEKKLIQALYDAMKADEEDLQENSPSPSKPQTEPGTITRPKVTPGEKPKIRRPLTPGKDAPDTRPKAEGINENEQEIVDKIAQRFDKLKNVNEGMLDEGIIDSIKNTWKSITSGKNKEDITDVKQEAESMSDEEKKHYIQSNINNSSLSTIANSILKTTSTQILAAVVMILMLESCGVTKPGESSRCGFKSRRDYPSYSPKAHHRGNPGRGGF